MIRFLFTVLFLLSAARVPAQPPLHAGVVESIIPWLASTASCWSEVDLQNVGSRAAAVELEAHRSSGALIPLVAPAAASVQLAAGERLHFKLELPEDTAGAWVRVREILPSPRLPPVLAVSGATQCLAAGELRTTVREVAWPAANPWYSSAVASGEDGILALINVSSRPATVRGCYSFGTLYSVPTGAVPGGELTPLCSQTIQEFLPPFASRQYPVARPGSTHFSLGTNGVAIVLEMLRPAASSVKLYRVDSSITFGKEVPDQPATDK